MQSKIKRARVANRLAKAAIVALGGLCLGAHAAEATGTFSVNVTLTPKCEVVSGTTGTTTIPNLALGYTSFQAAATTGSTTFYVRCTKSMPYSMSLGADTQASFKDSTTNLDVVLALSGSSTHSSTAAASLNGLTGDGSTTGQQYWVHGSVAAGQDGTVTAANFNAVTGSNARTLTITY